MNNPEPLRPSRAAELEAHIRLLNSQLERAELLRQRWMIAALCGWVLVFGLVWAVAVSGGK